MNIVPAFLTRNPYYTRNVNREDSRYTVFQERGPLGLMLHSVGCAQPSAEAFVKRWNNPRYTRACVHAFIDADSGDVWQTMPWNYRAPHCAGNANNTHVGVEMCESRYISYTGGASFEIIDKTRAQQDCARAYHAAVELFAYLCTEYGINPETGIISHREGGIQGIASGHADPEHYWTGLQMPYTMGAFRAAVKAAMEDKPDEDDPIYRIQVGAFRNRTYADAYLEAVKAAGFPNAYITVSKK